MKIGTTDLSDSRGFVQQATVYAQVTEELGEKMSEDADNYFKLNDRVSYLVYELSELINNF